MAYRVDFFISSIGIIILNSTGLLSIWVIFQTIPSIEGWNFHELLFLYAFALLSITPLQLFFDNIWELRNYLQEGSFIKYYYKPLNILFYFISERLDIKGFANLVLGIVLLVIASSKLGLQWTFLSILGLIALLICASLVMISLMLIAASTAFWIINSFSILNFFFKLKDFTRYPITIFNGFFKFFFTFIIPIAFVAYYPVQTILKPDSSSLYIYLSPFIGILFFILAYNVWKRGVRKYDGTGS
jgi:ABC-2 type transport system permease protein